MNPRSVYIYSHTNVRQLSAIVRLVARPTATATPLRLASPPAVVVADVVAVVVAASSSAVMPLARSTQTSLATSLGCDANH